jgi:hypothetical protein
MIIRPYLFMLHSKTLSVYITGELVRHGRGRNRKEKFSQDKKYYFGFKKQGLETERRILVGSDLTWKGVRKTSQTSERVMSRGRGTRSGKIRPEEKRPKGTIMLRIEETKWSTVVE